ncbi:hypothetical protein NLG97_g4031 [Lecanicillium saksenae]|uniref:Uncharacterized protein n=1 Tax=Lecanicillium saksenae TaxID=468837 RepID=A0ACC1QY68_9HYPO|nr:hypothetical protein NLG97_g4031 [Lecanicillium saksenae]
MPPLRGFWTNALVSRADAVTAAKSFLIPLLPYFSDGNALIKLPITSGAHFDDTAAALEGYARPLWVVATLLAARKHAYGQDDAEFQPILDLWFQGLQNGVDPSHDDYWGTMGDWDQRMVEAEVISFALLTAPDSFYEPLSPAAKINLATWLKGINGKIMPENNWRWFRVFCNLALIKVCGEEKDAYWPLIDKDLHTLEEFYLDDGWSSDGIWRPATAVPEDEGMGENSGRGRHADYYSGSFAIQFSQIMYAKIARDIDPERCAIFKRRACQFITSFWAYFDTDGAAIPFGRSLCYKFAMGAFYAAFAYGGLCDDSNPLSSHGAVKGMLLRHLRWWAVHSQDSFWPDGTLNIGYLYPNMHMSENYNSPQSPYWALKSFIVIALAESDPFWTAEELPHPLQAAGGADSRGVQYVKPARQILCNHAKGNHHFLLSSGQFCVWPMKATQAKYAKFAYSSVFGFSVPTGPLLAQIAPDNCLVLSQDGGETWAQRWISAGETEFRQITVDGLDSGVVAMISCWKPWPSGNVVIESTVIPPCNKWPDWHLRIHRIRRKAITDAPFSAVEGGFAIFAPRRNNGRVIQTATVLGETVLEFAQLDRYAVAVETADAALVISDAGASGIVDFTPSASGATKRGDVMRPDPNTNIMTTKTMIPNIRHERSSWMSSEFIIASGIFAVAGKQEPTEAEARWLRRPSVSFTAEGNIRLS